MRRDGRQSHTKTARWLWSGLVALSLFAACDAPARAITVARHALDAPLSPSQSAARVPSWTRALEPIEVFDLSSRSIARLRLYDASGEVDEQARADFERVVSRDGPARRLSLRLLQVVFKSAYRFGARRVLVVSAWRRNAGKHGTGDAIDFKLQGVRSVDLAGYLRGLPRLGVGLYTHPSTQFVHVDVRDTSYHWLDASPPGVHWRERQLGDPHADRRDAAYAPELDLPL